MARPAHSLIPHWERVIFFLLSPSPFCRPSPTPAFPMAQSIWSSSSAPCLWWSANSHCWPCLLSWILSLVAPFPPSLFPSPATAEISSSPALLFSLFNTNQSSFCSLLLYNFSWERVSKHPLAPAGARADRTKERSHPNLASWINEIIGLVYMSTREGFLQELPPLQDWNVPPHRGWWCHRIWTMRPCLQLISLLSVCILPIKPPCNMNSQRLLLCAQSLHRFKPSFLNFLFVWFFVCFLKRERRHGVGRMEKWGGSGRSWRMIRIN